MSKEFTNLFIDESKPVLKRTFSVNEEDYLLVQKVFPEWGFMQYLPGLMFKVIAEKLRNDNIHDAIDRIQHPGITSVPEFLSNFGPTWAESFRNVRRRTAKVRAGNAAGNGVASGTAQSPHDKGSDGQSKGEERQDAEKD